MKLGVRLRSIALFEQLGPGLSTGAPDDDPSGIATYSQAGAERTLREQGAARVACDAPLAKGVEMGWFEHGSTILLFCPRVSAFTGRWWKNTALERAIPLPPVSAQAPKSSYPAL